MTLDDVRKLADLANAQNCHWVEAWDAGIDLCWNCASAVAAGINECGDSETSVDGGSWYSGESDGCSICHRCGQLLHYTLTDYGRAEEVFHYAEHGVSIPLSPNDAYHLIAIEDSIPYGECAWVQQ